MHNTRVNIPKPIVKLHWPHGLCETCNVETIGNEQEGYTCPLCNKVYTGRTEYHDANVVYLEQP